MELPLEVVNRMKKKMIRFIMLCAILVVYLLAAGCNDSDACSIQKSANCYAYAFNWRVDPITGNTFPSKPQPGQNAKPPTYCYPLTKDCIKKAVEGDAKVLGKQFRETSRDETCPAGTYKIALVIANTPPSSVADYHWYRQNPDGTWSHKPGGTPVTNVDASGNPITDPAAADRNYKAYGLNYDEFAGYYCTGD
jgi:hypothetical protein